MEDCLTKAPEELERKGESGYQRAIARHSIEAQTAPLAAFFRDSGYPR